MEKQINDIDTTAKSKTVTLPRLNRLMPSLESTALKIMEEYDT
jgi:hypothetical protein